MNAASQHLQRAEAILSDVERADTDGHIAREILTLDLSIANTHIALATAQLLARRCQA